jgi:hypothetical protein
VGSLIDKMSKSTTTDKNDVRLTIIDDKGLQDAYLVLSESEREKGFVRPVRNAYVHWYMLDGSDVPNVITTTKGMGGCGALTTMSGDIAETYARNPKFYGATYCVGCKAHYPVDQFHWDKFPDQKVGS